WQPRQESSRASIAALMMQKEQADNQAPSYAGAVFTCGGGSGTSTSTATANNNCTIVVDSHGNIIDADQISDGDQTADSDTTTTANGLTEESMSDILDTLQEYKTPIRSEAPVPSSLLPPRPTFLRWKDTVSPCKKAVRR